MGDHDLALEQPWFCWGSPFSETPLWALCAWQGFVTLTLRTRLNPTCGMVQAKQQGMMVKRQLSKGAPIDSNSTCHWHVPQSGLLHGSVDLPAIPTGDVNEALGRIVAAWGRVPPVVSMALRYTFCAQDTSKHTFAELIQETKSIHQSTSPRQSRSPHRLHPSRQWFLSIISCLWKAWDVSHYNAWAKRYSETVVRQSILQRCARSRCSYGRTLNWDLHPPRLSLGLSGWWTKKLVHHNPCCQDCEELWQDIPPEWHPKHSATTTARIPLPPCVPVSSCFCDRNTSRKTLSICFFAFGQAFSVWAKGTWV